MLELEKTYLAKYLPDWLENCKSKEIFDIYFPVSNPHPRLRLRKNGEKYEMTKKEIMNGDVSTLMEHNIFLSADEFEALKNVEGKRVRKIRYYYPYGELTAEVDVFQDDLAGLVLMDFEFTDEVTKNSFEMPEFCLADVTYEDTIAGGMLCGRKYSDMESVLSTYEYKKI